MSFGSHSRSAALILASMVAKVLKLTGSILRLNQFRDEVSKENVDFLVMQRGTIGQSWILCFLANFSFKISGIYIYIY